MATATAPLATQLEELSIGRDSPVQPASHPARGRARRTAAPQGVARAPHRRGRTRLAAGALSRGGGRGHDRARGLRRRRRDEPAAPDRARLEGRRPAEARVGARSAEGPQPARARRGLRDAADERERARDRARLRHRDRRHGQLRDALSHERRVRDPRQAERVRQHLPVRGTVVGVRDGRRAVLSLPVSASRRRRASCRAARKAACSACCRASSARSRRRKGSSCCSASASR